MLNRDTAGWGFLAILGLLLIVSGFEGKFGSLLAVAFCPDQLQLSAAVSSDASSGGGGAAGGF